MQRLKDFPPNLTDIIVVASTASTDIGLFTRSKTPLTSDIPAEKVVNVFTTTTMAEDSRRGQLPLTDELGDTSPIGMALDLSSKDKIKRPLPQEEFEESPGPLPALMVLNNEGLLSTWWIVYAESIRKATTFPGLAIAANLQSQQQSQAQRQVSPFAASSPSSASNFGQSSFGKPSTPMGAFGGATSTPTSTLGSAPTPGTAFGAPSGLGQQKSVWDSSTNTSAGAQSTTSTFGQPSFGSSTTVSGITQGTAFGMAGGLSNKPSPWGTPPLGAATASTGAFGQPSKLGSQTSLFPSASPGGVFGSNVASNNSAPSSGGFASFATKPSGFLSATPSSGAARNIFGKSSTGVTLGAEMEGDSSFGPRLKKGGASEGPFGGNGGAFQLGSTFKADGTATGDAPKPIGDATGSMFGSNFSSMLGDAAGSQSKDAEMDDELDEASTNTEKTGDDRKDSLPSTAEPAKPKFVFPKTDPPKSGGLFGTQSQSKITPAEVSRSEPAGFSFGKPAANTTTPDETPKKPEDRPRASIETSPNIKEEPESDESISPLNEEEARPPEGYGETDSGASSRSKTPDTAAPSKSKLADPPLPPESTSKASYAPGDSSNSSKTSDDAPLPPDFIPSKTKLKQVEALPPEEARLPSDDEEGGLDDEGSGVDVAQEISPSNSNQSSKITLESSFGLSANKSPSASFFSSAQKQPEPQRGKSALFGEVGKATTPFFPPPTKTHESPRSPSPVRLDTSDSLRPDNFRSISAPVPFKSLNSRQIQRSRLAIPVMPKHSAEELRKQERQCLSAEQARRTAEERQDLIDDDDLQIRRLLESDVTASKTLDPFLAHQDYVGNIDKPGIPGQIEKIFRDINSMIDTLGLNARSLTAFAKGHEEQAKSTQRTRDDLEDIEDWCLVEVEDLSALEIQLSDELENNRLQDVPGKLATCRELRKGLSSLRRKYHDLGRTIDLRKDPSAAEMMAQMPLSLDQQTQQHDLRKAFKHFQKRLAEAEKAISLLRAQLASAENQSRKCGSNGRDVLKQPTVEAVQNTISKMTSMIERKRDDIALLEMQLRGLRFSTLPANGTTENGASSKDRNDTSFSFTRPYPASASKEYRNSLRNGYSKASSAMNSYRTSPLRRGVQEDDTPRNITTRLPQDEVEAYRAKARQRREVNAVIRDVFGKGDVRIRSLG